MRRPLLLFFLGAGLVAGCGPKMTPVNGTVTYDGAPIEGATVVFLSENGAKSAFGRTDAGGNFALTFDDAPLIPAGTYKVMVTHRKAVEAVSPGNPDEKLSKSYLKEMKAKEPPKGGPVGIIPVGKAATKTDFGDLPAMYGSPTTTPFTIQVPVSGPVELKLEKKK